MPIAMGRLFPFFVGILDPIKAAESLKATKKATGDFTTIVLAIVALNPVHQGRCM